MPRFKFSLEGVLKVRRLVEEQAQAAFSAKLAECETLKRRILEAESGLIDFKNSGQYEGFLDPLILMQRSQWAGHLQNEILKAKEKLREARMQQEELRKALARASQEKKAIEKLKEKKLEEFKAEIKKKEQNFTDEMASVRFFRSEKSIEE